MKVCKKVRLLTKKEGKFNTDGQKEVLRNRMIISNQVIEETNKGSKDTGLMYIIDEEATALRNKKNTKKVTTDTKK